MQIIIENKGSKIQFDVRTENGPEAIELSITLDKLIKKAQQRLKYRGKNTDDKKNTYGDDDLSDLQIRNLIKRLASYTENEIRQTSMGFDIISPRLPEGSNVLISVMDAPPKKGSYSAALREFNIDPIGTMNKNIKNKAQAEKWIEFYEKWISRKQGLGPMAFLKYLADKKKAFEINVILGL